MGEARSQEAQQVMRMFNEVQLCREMGWTPTELDEADDDFIWLCFQVLGLEAEKQKMDEQRGGRNPGAQIHHEASAPPIPMNEEPRIRNL